MARYVVRAKAKMAANGVIYYTGAGNRWSTERPDAQEFDTWRAASLCADMLFEGYPTSPAAQRAEVAEEA